MNNTGDTSGGCESFRQLQTYMKALSPMDIQQLYSCPTACVATLRSFGGVGQQILLRLVFVEKPILRSLVDGWFKPLVHSEVESMIQDMQALRILDFDVAVQEGPVKAEVPLETVLMNEGFRAGFKASLLGRRFSSLIVAKPDSKHGKTADELEQYAAERWECLLYYLALSSNELGPISSESKSVLLSAGFVHIDPKHPTFTPEITSKGFQFLLTDRATQIWIYLLKYLSYLQSKEQDNLVSCLSFLFELSFCVPGQAYNSEKFDRDVGPFVQHLREIGLIYQAKIIEYIISNANDQMLHQNPIIPAAVNDQIKLWESERGRYQFTEGVLYSQFLSDDDFIAARDYAKNYGILQWENETQRVMIVTAEGHDIVRKFWKRLKKT